MDSVHAHHITYTPYSYCSLCIPFIHSCIDGVYSLWGLIPFVTALTAVLLACVAVGLCNTIQFGLMNTGDEDAPINNQSNGTTFEPSSVHLGPWSVQGTELVSVNIGNGQVRYLVRQVCRYFPDDTDIDANWKVVRAFSIMTPIIGALMAILILFSNCTYYLSPAGWKKASFMFLVILPIFQGLSFLLLESNACSSNPVLGVAPPSPITTDVNTWIALLNSVYESDCTWSKGMGCNVAATVLFFVTGALMLALGTPTAPPTPPPETQAVTYERKQNTDGTVTVAQTNVVKGTAVVPPVEANVAAVEENNNKETANVY